MDRDLGVDYVEGVVCSEEDIKENEMKQFDLTDAGKVLLVRQNGKLSALGTKCTHYGAPLASGALSNGRLRCQWHGACFNLTTGDIEDFPGLDSLPCYQVSVEAGQVKVRAKRTELETNKRVKEMAKRDPNNVKTFVIVGAGPSGVTCAQTLREEGFTGRIVVISKETVLPYDRIKVNKAMDSELEKILLRKQEFYDDNDIEVMLDVEATKLDTKDQAVSCSNGYIIKYDKIYVATGSKARKHNCPGADLPNVVTIRDYVDAQYIVGNISKQSHIVVLGVSFIGLEAAAWCAGKVARVTVVGRGSVPLEPVFGREVGARIMQMFREKGVQFAMNSGIERCLEENGKLCSVQLTDGQIIRADLCIMGVGSTLYTDFMKGSGVELNPDGSVDTDLFLEANVQNVYVGGDIANAPVYSIGLDRATIGHFGLAQYHGRIAALNMSGKRTQLKAVPYFWTVLFGKSFRYAGHGRAHEIRIIGSLPDLKFIAYHFDESGKVIGVCSCQRDPVVSQFAELQAQGKTLRKEDLEEDPLAWTATVTCQKK
ncbi:apoptosis-inducing factor 3 isoform X2 [Phlebotomus argentipes]|nr:apoptosis-inducing factor 3 isoform X2 [Phlebotomus argentipes]XP_059621752.1 apoptosis-inducing factor 3 isoform X2 [Phlebotomus argentipes]XP_059621759.1 apoptosis-inducing factor 3 isoform X2 [Phlebotomus argentipes]XP_059621767.1 apoptosis-inducing factor 3 isoform X2 [Phlebotomus argentipes]